MVIKQNYLITTENLKTQTQFSINKKYSLVLGHSRYATSYQSLETKTDIYLSHPFEGTHGILGTFHLIHNGNINFNEDVKKLYPKLTDTKILVKFIEKENGDSWQKVISNIIRKVPGVYNVILAADNKLFAFKDRFNLRPLCFGENQYGFCVASESVALGTYTYNREIVGGEMLEISTNGYKISKVIENDSRICLFEFIYFLNKDTKFNDIAVHSFRYNLGFELAKLENIEDISTQNIVVIGSPDTGIPSGKGFADKMDFEYQQFLEKNKNSGRSFILKDDQSRTQECNKKFLINPEFNINGKIVYFVDDSIVRGITTKKIISILKHHGAAEIHIRISSPKIIDICKFGIDIPTKDELVMNRMSEAEYVAEYGINSLKYLPLENMRNVIGSGLGISDPEKSFCIGCFGGGYDKSLLDW